MDWTFFVVSRRKRIFKISPSFPFWILLGFREVNLSVTDDRSQRERTPSQGGDLFSSLTPPSSPAYHDLSSSTPKPGSIPTSIGSNPEWHGADSFHQQHMHDGHRVQGYFFLCFESMEICPSSVSSFLHITKCMETEETFAKVTPFNETLLELWVWENGNRTQVTCSLLVFWTWENSLLNTYSWDYKLQNLSEFTQCLFQGGFCS